MNKHRNTLGWWAMPDEMLDPPAHRDGCADCGVALGAPTRRELDLLAVAHAVACPRRCVVHLEAR